MAEWFWLAPLVGVCAALTGAGFLLQRRTDIRWLWSWCALLTAAGCTALVPVAPSLAFVAPIFGSLFVVLQLRGALLFAGRTVPGWLVAAGLGVGLLRANLALAGVEAAVQGVALLLHPVALALGAWIAWGARRRGSPLRFAIGPSLLLLGGVELLEGLRVPLDLGPLGALWVGIAFPAAVIQMYEAVDGGQREHARASGALQASEERFRHLAEHARDLIVEFDATGRLIYVSPNLWHVLGYDPAELLGRGLLELGERMGVRTEQLLQLDVAEPAFADLQAHDFERGVTRVRHADGGWRWLETNTNIYRAADGGQRMIGVSRDVTDRVEFEEERRALEARVQESQRRESLGALAGRVARDFGRRLDEIRAEADRALAELSAGADPGMRVREIRSASARASELTDELLAFAGEQKIVARILDLAALARDAVSRARPVVAPNAALQLAPQTSSPRIQGDSAQLHRALQHVLANGAESLEGRPRGTVRVRTGIMQADPPYLKRCEHASRLEEGSYAFVEVSDDGRGMDAQVLPRIFEPFFTTRLRGRGLGLAAARGIVNAHGGGIHVVSDPEQGACFRLIFPCVSDDT